MNSPLALPLDGLAALPTPSIMAVRRFAVQLTYQMEHDVSTVLSNETAAVFCDQNAVSEDLRTWVLQVAARAWDDRERLDGWIRSVSKNWNLSRIGRIERAILRVCLTELGGRSNVSAATIMADAAEIAKEFGTEKSSSFVHGILDAVYREQVAPGSTRAGMQKP